MSDSSSDLAEADLTQRLVFLFITTVLWGINAI